MSIEKPANDLSRRGFLGTTAAGAATMYLAGSTTQARAEEKTAGLGVTQVDRDRWPELADVALGVLKKSKVDYGDIRLIDTRNQSVRASDRRISSVSESSSGGFGIRALYKGAWGFAASAILTPDEVRRTAALAVEVARASSKLVKEPVVLADEPQHVETVRTDRSIDPFSVPLDQKTELLLQVSEILHKEKLVKRSNASLWVQRDLKFFASTEDTQINFDLLAVGGGFGATAVGDGEFQSRSLALPYFRSGYEHIISGNFIKEAPRVAAEAVEKLKARDAAAGTYDMILDPAHLSLTIHESCGHPTELDRALGYEANYAGTSFLTPEKLNNFQYGSKHVNLVADNTLPGGMASTGFDDDGVACQKWDIVREGKFVGYSTNREVAGKIGEKRSRGSNRADSWGSIPIVRIANIGLQPGSAKLDDLIAGVDNGIYITGRGSFSIDQKRYNFQFGGDAFWEIKNGKKGAMLKNVIYTGITPEFWGSCDGVADAGHWKPYGFITCGKGQPGQSGWMTHGAAHARFRGVNVIEGKSASKKT